MRGAAVAWTFGPDSKDANGEPIRPHATYCDLDRVGYGVAPDTYVTRAARWSLDEQLVADLSKRCMTLGSTPSQTSELIRRIHSDPSRRLTNGGKVITLTHAIISLDLPYAARRGALRPQRAARPPLSASHPRLLLEPLRQKPRSP